MRRPRVDFDAALWLTVAYFGAAFGILPVLLTGLAMTGAALDGLPYLAANAGVVTLAFTIAAAMLVRAEPSRRLGDLAFTLWALGVAATGAQTVLRIIGGPRQAFSALLSMAAPFTFGLVQLDSVAPLRLGPPDPWALVGVALGFTIAGAVLRARGRKVGAAADHGVTPMRLPGSRHGGDAAGR